MTINTRAYYVLVIFVAVIVMVASSASNDDEVGAGCLSIVTSLQPCLDFLKGKEPSPSKNCCKGAKEVDDETKTSKDKQEACQCIEDALKSFSKIDDSRIPEIPKQCNITTTLPPIVPNFNCSTLSNA